MSFRVKQPYRLFFLTLPAAMAVSACSESSESLDASGNLSPVLVAHAVTTDEDVPVEVRVLDGASNPDGEPLQVTLASAPGHVVELRGNGVIRVIPKPDFNGMFDVAYTASDGEHAAVQRVHVTVRPVNDAPIVSDSMQNVRRSADVVLSARDVDGDTLTYEIVKAPAHGTLTGQPPALHYAPEAGFLGEDTLAFRASDGVATSAPATIRFEVSLGSAPVAFSDTIAATEDQPRSVFLGASDADGDVLTFTIVTPPGHGTLSGTAPSVTYTPAPNFAGDDMLQFSVSDGILSSGTATIAIHVAAVNDPPVAIAQTVATTEDIGVVITLQGSDVEGDALTFSVQTGPSHGTLSGSGATRTYTPTLNYHGPDSFTFLVLDSSFQSSAPVTVTIAVASVEDPPVAGSFTRSLSEDTPAAIALQGSDGDGDPISYTVATLPGHGTLSGTAPTLTYTPDANYNGSDSFTYTVSSGGVTSAPGTVTLQVAPVNDAPVAVSSVVTTDEDTPVAITLQASDIDSPSLTFTILTPPADGTLTGTGATRTYTPALNKSGTRSFSFSVSDGSLGATGTVTISITPVNDPPTAVDDYVFTEPGTPRTFGVTDNDFDVEGDTFVLDSVAAPAHGDVEIVGGQLVYTPAAEFIGVDVFAYTVVDVHGAASTGNAHVGIGAFPPGAPAETIATVGGSLSTDLRLAPTISDDGRYLAFCSALPLVGDDTNGVEDVYLYDRGTRTMTRVSVATGGGQGNGDSFRVHLSADGRYAVFESVASNLVAGDTNGVSDVFRHDRVTGETVRVSVATGGGQASGASLDATISDDGNLVAFASSAFDLIASDANGASDAFVRDLTAGTTTRVSVTATGGEGDFASTEPVISGDGRFVAFSSPSTNMVAGDTNNVSDVFLRDRVAGTTARVSVSSTGGEANRACLGPSLSRDGRFISFRSDATNLVLGAPVPIQAYVRDVQGQTTTRPVSSTGTILSARLSADGRYVAEYNSAGVLVRDRFAAISASLPNAARLSFPVFSGNGRYVAVLDLGAGGSVTVLPNPL